MLQPDLSLQVRLLAEATRLPEAALPDRVSSVARLAPGQPVTARILEQLPDGRYKVQIAGRSLAMQLPMAAKPGQDIRLVYISSEPNLTFGLAQQQESSAIVSNAGRLVSTLAATNQSSVPAAAAEPLFESMPASASEIAPRLREALTLSGLFYESHQAQWVDGERPLNQLLREPQGKLAAIAVAQKQSGVPTMAPVAKSDIATAMVAAGDVSSSTMAGNASGGSQNTVNPESLPIIQQQLGTLETGQIIWHGQIWPGQVAEWKVSKFSDGHQAAAQQDSSWETELSLAMSALGTIDARLRLQQGGIAISLQADDAAAAQLLQRHSAELVDAMNAAGLTVNEVKVSNHAAA